MLPTFPDPIEAPPRVRLMAHYDTQREMVRAATIDDLRACLDAMTAEQRAEVVGSAPEWPAGDTAEKVAGAIDAALFSECARLRAQVEELKRERDEARTDAAEEEDFGRKIANGRNAAIARAEKAEHDLTELRRAVEFAFTVAGVDEGDDVTLSEVLWRLVGERDAWRTVVEAAVELVAARAMYAGHGPEDPTLAEVNDRTYKAEMGLRAAVDALPPEHRPTGEKP